MRIWITGVAGFLGSHLADALIADGHTVSGNDNLSCGDVKNLNLSINWENADCEKFSRMNFFLGRFKPDVVVHAAALAHEGLSNFSPSFITRSIYEASVSTFSAAINSGVKRIVFLSSMARYGNQKPPFTESMRPQPIDPYGIAKVAAEDTLKALCRVHDVKWSVAVPHNIIGARQNSTDPFRNVAAIMINRCKQGKPPIIYGDGLQTRCFSPVRDCIPSLVKMVNGKADGEIINIGPDNGEITVKELAEKITKLTHFAHGPVHLPGRPNEVREAYCSSAKVRKLLGYKEVQSLEDCLAEMVKYIKAADFVYNLPIEIITGCPDVWLKNLM